MVIISHQITDISPPPPPNSRGKIPLLLFIQTYIIPGPPEGKRPCLNDIHWVSRCRNVPELDGAIMTAGGELRLSAVAPV